MRTLSTNQATNPLRGSGCWGDRIPGTIQ
jgi:hypothetical protein